jgi:hypothetical protein
VNGIVKQVKCQHKTFAHRTGNWLLMHGNSKQRRHSRPYHWPRVNPQTCRYQNSTRGSKAEDDNHERDLEIITLMPPQYR